jgi:thioredoxin-related protein
MNKKTGGLADLFRPPLELMFKGSFEKAKSHATSTSRWLLVNVQDPGIFDCQLLNRDTWSDEGLKKIIQTSFIMLQLTVMTDQASEYT